MESELLRTLASALAGLGVEEHDIGGMDGRLLLEDPAAFARRMVNLAADSALARKLGAAAAERAHLFTWQAFVAGLDDAVDRMVAKRN